MASNNHKPWSNGDDQKLMELYKRNDVSVTDIANDLGRTRKAVMARKRLLFLDRKPKVLNEYALYKGEELLCMGNAKEIAEQMNVKLSTIYTYLSDKYRSKYGDSKNRRNVVKIS